MNYITQGLNRHEKRARRAKLRKRKLTEAGIKIVRWELDNSPANIPLVRRTTERMKDQHAKNITPNN